MDNYRAKASKRNYEQQNPKQREKRKSTFNQYNNLYLNSPVNFISSGNNEHSKNDNEDDENNINGRCEQYPSPPSPPNMRNHDYEVHQTPQLKGIGGKLLLQMGYEPGKGLGKNLQGIQVPIKAKPRYGRGAIGAYGPENINALPIETINRNSRGYDNKNKFVADEIIDLINYNDTEQIDNVNNEYEDNTILNKITKFSMDLSDETSNISLITQTIDNTFQQNNDQIKNDLDLNINSSWNLSIIGHDYPKLQLTGDHYNEIEYKIFNILYNNNDNFNEPIQFHNSELINGTMQVVCANETTKNWLYQVIDNNNTLLNNIKLRIIETDSIRKYKQIKFLLYGPKLSAEMILKILQKQNHNFNTDKWRVYELNYFRDIDSIELIVGIDCISFAELKKLNLKPFYRFGRCSAYLSK